MSSPTRRGVCAYVTCNLEIRIFYMRQDWEKIVMILIWERAERVFNVKFTFSKP